MGTYIGTVNCREFANKLDEFLLLEGYTQISSSVTDDGRVYKTLGVSGVDEFYIRLVDPVSNYITLGVYETYEPNATNGMAGTFGNGYDTHSVTWNRSNTLDTHKVNYVININKDRLIIFVEGMQLDAYWCRSLSYIGLPKRFDPNDTGAFFAGITGIGRMPWNSPNYFLALRSRERATIKWYETGFYLPATTSKGWGNQLFFSPIFIGTNGEGARGQFDGLYLIESIDENYDVRHRDTFSKDGKTYMVIETSRSFGGNQTLHTAYDYIIEV